MPSGVASAVRGVQLSQRLCDGSHHCNMSDLVPPANAEDAKTSHVKGLQGLDMTMILNLCFTAVQMEIQNDGFVDCYFGRYCMVTIYEYTVRKPAEGSRSKLYPLLDFVIQITVIEVSILPR